MVIALRSGGSAFQALGPATTNALSAAGWQVARYNSLSAMLRMLGLVVASPARRGMDGLVGCGEGGRSMLGSLSWFRLVLT